MFCQACGVQNAEDARFCNMCGTRIAKPGTPGGMLVDKTQFGIGPSELAAAEGADVPGSAAAIAAAIADAPTQPAESAPAAVAVGGSVGAPSVSVSRPRVSLQGPMPTHGGPSMMSVSLAGIGVQSSARAWITVVLIALVLIGGGGIATWLLMKSSADRIAQSGRAEPDDPFVIGTPQPVGEVNVDGVTGNPVTPTAADAGGGSPPGPGPGPGMSEPGMSEPGMSEPGMSEPGMSEPDPDPDPDPGGSEPDPDPDPDVDPDERDIGMDLYAARVRFVIRRYYAARAQSCFDHATRNNPTLDGTVVVALTVGRDGNVTRSSVARNTTGDDDLGRCLATQVRQWRFPVPPGGESLDMTMPFSR